MKECRICNASDMTKDKRGNMVEGFGVWFSCPVHGNICEKCATSEGFFGKPVCKICGKKLNTKRWF